MSTTGVRADLHCHSTASAVSKLGVQRALGMPECATPPEEVYALAKRRGMDFVTITDHDTIDGSLELAGRYADAFVSEELTTWFRGEPQAVHLLCFGITPDDHEWLQANARDVEAVAEYLDDRQIARSLAHPFYAVEAPLTARHRRRLAQLFDVWEVRNGARARELNAPASIYVDTHGGAGTGGSDDHGGIDIGRTWTQTPRCRDWRDFLAHVRAGRTVAGGAQGSAAKWTHSAVAIALRALGPVGEAAAPDPASVLRMVERLMSEGDARRGAVGADLGPDDARALLRAWLDSLELDLGDGDLIAHMQADDFSHGDLFRRAQRLHGRRLAAAVQTVVAGVGALVAGGGGAATGGVAAPAGGAAPAPELFGAATAVFDACVSAVPYAPAAAFLGREKARLVGRDAEPVRVALVADGIGGVHGVARTLEQIRERGVPGFEVEVVGTDADVDRRLSAVAEVDLPFYAGLRIGVPGLPAVVEAIAEGRYGLVHVATPGPAGAVAALVARVMGLPLMGSYHTELAAYARVRTGSTGMELGMAALLGAFHARCVHTLTPSAASDAALRALGVDGGRLGRWDRGVDTARFSPAHRDPQRFAGAAADGAARVNVLYAGRLAQEKGVELLAAGFLRARAVDPRLHLVLAGGGPEEDALRARLGDAATFLGWEHGDDLAATYASADLFCFASQTDTFGQVVLEAQASGLPVVAVAAGGPLDLIEDGRSGLLVEPHAEAVAAALCGLAASRPARDRLAAGGLAAVRARTWERSMEQLAAGYRATLTHAAAGSRAA